MAFKDISLRTREGKKQHIKIVHEDEDILVLDKPPGIPVVPDHWNPDKTNLYDLLNSQIKKDTTSNLDKIWVVHRIDQDTSGLVVFAKHSEAHLRLNKAFSNGKVHKTYLAIVKGCPAQKSGRIDFKLSSPRKGRVVVDPAGKKSLTEYQVIEQFARFSILKVFPRTGRTHQIRVHLYAIGHPLVVDPVYTHHSTLRITDLKRYARIQTEERPALISRLTLHAMMLKFEHPISGISLEFHSDVPKDMQAVIKALKKWDSLRATPVGH